MPLKEPKEIRDINSKLKRLMGGKPWFVKGSFNENRVLELDQITTVAELSEVLATLISDLKKQRIFY